MASQVKFPIRTKLLLLMSGFVLLSTLVYLGIATQIFKDDKIELVYELNASTVKTLATQVESSLQRVVDKVRLLTQSHHDSEWTRSLFESEPLFISYTLYESTAETPEWTATVTHVQSRAIIKNRGLSFPTSVPEIKELRKKVPIPFKQILQQKVWIQNATFPGEAPMLTLALSIMTENSKRIIAVVDVRTDGLLQLLSHRKIGTVYLVDPLGKIVVHPDAKFVTTHQDVGDVPIVKEAMSAPVKMKLMRFDWKNTSWIGAYASVGMGGLSVISQVPESQAFLALNQLLKRSFYFALLILTASLLVSDLLAGSFTGPLEKLVAATERLAKWEFGQSIFVNTQDEMAQLARSFNAMASDLQNQRQQLREHEIELERRVSERTLELENEKKKLFETQDALLRTTRLASLGELAGVAAHEVLNPINNMNIRVEKISQYISSRDQNDAALLSEIILSWKKAFIEGGWNGLKSELEKPAENAKSMIEEDLNNLESIAQEVQNQIQVRAVDMEFLKKEILRVSRIVNNMRSLSRVGGERRSLDIHTPLDETSLALTDHFKKKNIALVKDYSADPRELFRVVGDKDELVQVFSNLVRNALQAIVSAQRSPGVVRISTQHTENRIEIRIADNGNGISEENKPKLFEPSFTTKTLEEGTGLGLSISRRLVRAFGGDIVVEKTREGEGTVFLVWLPLEVVKS